MCGVYAIINKKDKTMYIGSSNNIELRWYQHKNDLNKGKHCNTKIQEAWNEFGPDAFSFTVLEETTEDSRMDSERIWIEKYNLTEVGYNISKERKATTEEKIQRRLKRYREIFSNAPYIVELPEEQREIEIQKQLTRVEGYMRSRKSLD